MNIGRLSLAIIGHFFMGLAFFMACLPAWAFYQGGYGPWDGATVVIINWILSWLCFVIGNLMIYDYVKSHVVERDGEEDL